MTTLGGVRQDAERELAAIAGDRALREQSGAVNWGDLAVESVERYRRDDGNRGHRVWIEEASPGCELCVILWARLADTYPDVEVCAKW